MSNHEKLFELWLEGKLSKQEAAEFESVVAQDSELAARLESAQGLYHQAACYEEVEVPHWDRDATFATETKPWWQWQWLPLTSLACSVVAIALVLLRVEIVVQDDGVMIAFASSKNQQRHVETIIDNKLKEFAGEQQVVLANYMTEMTQSQQEVNMQLAGYVLDATRKERKQDMNDFVRYVNDMRSEDNLNDAMRFQRIEHKLTGNMVKEFQKSTLLNNRSQSEQEK